VPRETETKDIARPVVPSPATVASAQKILHQFRADGPRFVLQDRESGISMEIDETVYDLIRRLLIDLAQNRPVSIIPYDHELTTYEAADLLNVSRGYVLKLLNEKKLAHKMVGTHRRIRLEELLAYKDKMFSDSERAADELTPASQDLGLE
jgi:excisionase family DNA binding protein